MSQFRIIPVIDILNSCAVHALKGDRKNYKPLKSDLFNSSKPLHIIKTLKKMGAFKEIYIADLDSIIKRNPNLDLLYNISELTDLEIMLDPGIIDEKDLKKFQQLKVKKLILGLETLKKIHLIETCQKILGSDKIIISLDLYQGKVISQNEYIASLRPIDIIYYLEKIGIKEIILLDLFRVGQKIGGVPPFYIKIRQNFKGSLLVGGGIKNMEDIKNLIQNKFDGALIATSLYDGTIGIDELMRI